VIVGVEVGKAVSVGVAVGVSLGKGEAVGEGGGVTDAAAVRVGCEFAVGVQLAIRAVKITRIPLINDFAENFIRKINIGAIILISATNCVHKSDLYLWAFYTSLW